MRRITVGLTIITAMLLTASCTTGGQQQGPVSDARQEYQLSPIAKLGGGGGQGEGGATATQRKPGKQVAHHRREREQQLAGGVVGKHGGGLGTRTKPGGP